jgi:large subunit ribosomal protein L28
LGAAAARLADNPSWRIYLPFRFKDELMAKRCEICGKSPVVGRQHSHANNVSARRFEPNLQMVRAMINGGIRRIRVCTRCLRSNKVAKAA